MEMNANYGRESLSGLMIFKMVEKSSDVNNEWKNLKCLWSNSIWQQVKWILNRLLSIYFLRQ